MSVNIKQNGSLVKISGSSSWTGTRAEYEAVKDTIPVGSVVNITDDSDPKFVNPTVDISQEIGNLIEEKDDGIYANIPTYTREEYETIKSTIPVGALFNISDDSMITSQTNQAFVKTITAKTGFTITLTRSGNFVLASLVSANVKVINAASTWEILCNIPDGYKPLANMYSTMYDPNGKNFWQTQCTTQNNDIRIFGTYTSNAWAFGELVWLTGDEYPAEND